MGSIRRARIPEVPVLAAIIANAFSHDPILTWTFPGPRLEERLRLFFDAFAARIAERGWLWTIEGLDAVAMWAPPASDETLAEIDASTDPIARELTGDGGARYRALWDRVESHRPTRPHRYLDLLAVAEGRRGMGLGSALVRHGLAEAGTERAPVFLVTSGASTAGFYSRLGFGILARDTVPGGGPELWLMRWDPVAARSRRRGRS
jgi:GNAT superfamily N-acetyltransferase